MARKVHEYRYDVTIRDRGPKKNDTAMVRYQTDDPAVMRKWALPTIQGIETMFGQQLAPTLPATHCERCGDPLLSGSCSTCEAIQNGSFGAE